MRCIARCRDGVGIQEIGVFDGVVGHQYPVAPMVHDAYPEGDTGDGIAGNSNIF